MIRRFAAAPPGTRIMPLCAGYFNNLFMFCQCKVRLFKKAVGKVIGIALLIDNFSDARIDQHFKTNAAGQGGAEEGCTIDADAVECCLDDGVLLRMKATAQLMPLAGRDLLQLSDTANLFAVRKSCGNAIVAGCQYPLIFYHNSTNLPAYAG